MRKMLGKDVENKEIGHSIEVLTNHNSAIANPDLVPIIPEIASGTDGSTRLGDRIKPKSLVVKGVFSIKTDDDYIDNKALLVRCLILSQKDVKVGSRVGVDTDPSHLLRTAIPAASEIPFAGNRNEILYRVNENKFRVYMDKTFLLAPTAATADPLGNSQVNNVRTFSYVFKDLPANLTFDEGNGDWANNFAPFFCLGYAFADGSSPDVVATRVISDVYSRLSYEDA